MCGRLQSKSMNFVVIGISGGRLECRGRRKNVRCKGVDRDRCCVIRERASVYATQNNFDFRFERTRVRHESQSGSQAIPHAHNVQKRMKKKMKSTDGPATLLLSSIFKWPVHSTHSDDLTKCDNRFFFFFSFLFQRKVSIRAAR